MTALPSPVEQKIRRLERLLRIYVAVDGAVTLLIAVVLILGIDVAVDRFFEPSQLVRGFLLLSMLAMTAYVFWLRIGRRVFATIRDEQLATVFERFVPGLNESLITAVEFDETRQEEVEPLFMERTVDWAEESLQGVEVRKFFRYGRLTFRCAAAMLVVGLAIGLCATFAETAELWFSRNILLSSKDWPRHSQIVVDGFADGKVRIGRGDSFTLTVRASTAMPLVPETVRLHVGSKKGGYRSLLLDQFRIDTLDGTDWRTFTYTFAEMLETLPVSVSAADSRLDGLTIEVVPPPTLADVKIRQHFPEYIQREERTVSPSGRISVPDGTNVTIFATASKPLVAVRVGVNGTEPIPLNLDSPESFSFFVQNLREDRLVEFTLEDDDGLRNRQPICFDFSVIKDQPPVVTARLDGIGSVITPVAVLPTLGEIVDDYGLGNANFRYTINQFSRYSGDETPPKNETTETKESTDTGAVNIPGIGNFQTLFPLDREFAVEERSVAPGDKIAVFVEATDKFDLDGATGQTGVGPNWPLEIVSAERLKGLLEVREITLRQRFEVLIGEVEKTKAILEEYSLTPPKELVDEIETSLVVDEQLTDDAKKKREAEREKTKKERLELLGREQAESGMYAISRMLRDTKKEVYEQRTIIESFLSIRKEMVNNRIFSDEIRERIDTGIVGPMQALIDAEFPEADRLLDVLNKSLEIRNKPIRTEAITQQKSALDQFDRILEKMRAIRDSMISMESFNEAIELLRTIIRQQNQLRNETQEEKNRQLKKLLE